MKYVTIDTGLKGAMVLVDFFEPVDALTFKRMGQGIDSFEVAEKLKEWKPDRIYIEAISARPNQSTKATFTQALVYGQTHSIAQLHCEYLEYIYPQTWTAFTKRLSDQPNRPSKEIAAELAVRFFPEFCQPYFTPRSKKIHDGIADALCLHIYVNRDEYLSSLV